MKKILSVAIPTFNRVDKLKECLNSLLPEIAGKPVELLVSDNASQDGTQAYMEELCREHPEVTYFRNSENVGPDRNFLNCYNRASGEYVYLLGDDDVLLPGAMDAVLETLARKPVILRLNTSRLVSTQPLRWTDVVAPEEGVKAFTNATDFLMDIGIYITFMSAFILRRDLVYAVENKEQYIGTYFIQSHIAMRTLSTAGEYLFLTKNCIAADISAVPFDVYFVWGKMYGTLLREGGADAGLDPEKLRLLHKKDLRNTIYGFVRGLRPICPESNTWDKKAILDEVKPYPKLFIRYFLAIYLPVPVIETIKKIRCGIRKILRR